MKANASGPSLMEKIKLIESDKMGEDANAPVYNSLKMLKKLKIF